MNHKKLSRLAITTSPELRRALMEFSEVSGMAMSSFCRQMLEESIPVIQAMTKAYKVAYEHPEHAVEEMREIVEGATQKASQAQLELEETAKNKVTYLRKARNDRLVKD